MKTTILEILKNNGVEALNEAIENGKIDYVELVDLLDEDDELIDEIIERIIDNGYSLDDDLARANDAIIENCGDEIGYSASARNAKNIENIINNFLMSKVELEKLANAINQFIYKYDSCKELKELLEDKSLI